MMQENRRIEKTEETVLRPMGKADVAQVTELEKACFSDAWSEKLVSELLTSSFDEVWVLAHSDGEIVGYINVRFLAGEGELMRIAVKTECRGLGYSRKLMDRMIKSAYEQATSELTLEVRAGNEPAIGLYKSYGFVPEAVRKGYYHNPTEDALIMWLHGLPSIPT